jgi:WD40 repeat protein
MENKLKTKEVEIITALSFHPSGEYFLCGTRHPTIRLYNAETQVNEYNMK